MSNGLIKNLLPALLLIDPNAKLSLLRSEAHSEEKNTLMMTILIQQTWWLEYQSKLERRRERGRGPWPAYPDELVEEVEFYVDSRMRSKYPEYTR
jgi:hypothetical protein